MAALVGVGVLAAVSGSRLVTPPAAAQRGEVSRYWVTAELTGAAWVKRTFQKVTVQESDTFSDLYFAEVEDRNGVVTPVGTPLHGVTSAGLKTWTNTQTTCVSHPHASTNNSELGTNGIRIWESADRGVTNRDPGPHNVLVTGDSSDGGPWSQLSIPVAGAPQFCRGGMDFFTLGSHFTHALSCVIHPNGSCAETYSVPVVSGSSNGTVDQGAGTLKLVARLTLEPPDVRLSLLQLSPDLFFDLPLLDSVRLSFPPFDELPRLTKDKAKLPEDGDVQGRLVAGGRTVATTKGKLRKGVPRALPITWSRTGVDALRSITRPTLLTATFTATSAGAKPLTVQRSLYLLPASKTAATPPPAATPSITSVGFHGGPSNPSFVVHGRNLGSTPQPDPSAHPAGLNGCPAVAGDSGYDYGTSLYVVVPARNWSGGRHRADLNETDCIDLVVTKFTSREVDFHFGPFFTRNSTTFPLENGDAIQFAVNGALATFHVRYGATTSS